MNEQGSFKSIQLNGKTPTRGAGAALLLLLLINLFNYIDRYVLAALVPAISADLLVPNDFNAGARMGFLAPAFLISYMFGAPVFGWFGDRVSRWWLIGLGVILWSLASGGSGLATSFSVLFLTRCFVGVGEAAYGPVAPTIIADLYPVERRGRVLAWFYAAIPVGSALGYALGGRVVAGDSRPDQAAVAAIGLGGVPAGALSILSTIQMELVQRHHWRWGFYLVVPPGVLLGLWAFFMREPARGQADPGSRTMREVTWGDYLSLFRIRSYVLNSLGMAAMTFAFGGLAFWMPTYLVDERRAPGIAGLDPQTFFGGLVALAGLTATLAGGFAGDRLRTRFPGSYFLVSGVTMLLGFPMVLLVLRAPFPWNWLVIFVTVFCLFFNTGPTNTILANVTHPSIRAGAFALNIFIIHILGDVISPPIMGAIRDRTPLHSFERAFIVVSFMILVGGIIWLLGARYLAEDTALAPNRLAPD
jgi:MFS family permease